jgi:hypothetical protein
MRLVTRSLSALALAALFTLGLVATTPEPVFSCGGFPHPPCCGPNGANCLGGPGTGGGGGRVDAPTLPSDPGAWGVAIGHLLGLV